MNEKPYHNEPGFEEKPGHRYRRRHGAGNPVQDYNAIIRHETIRVAVLDMLEPDGPDTRQLPSALREKIIELFRTKQSFYEKVINDNLHLTGTPMRDPFSDPRSNFDYQKLKERLAAMKLRYPPDEDPTKLQGVPKEYNKIAAIHASVDAPPSFNNKDIDVQAVIDDANYYLDEEGTDGEEEQVDDSGDEDDEEES